jgi:hypothetical protein
MPLRNHRLPMAGVITARFNTVPAGTPTSTNPHHGKSIGLHHGQTARPCRVFTALLAAIALLVAACTSSSGGPGVANVGSSSAGASSSPSGSVSNGPLAFSQCMRSHGIPNFPDPGSNGSVQKETAQQLGVSSSQYQAATSGCGQLLPNSDQGGLSQAQIQQAWSGTRNFAQCMRSHGVSNWPDPLDDGTGSPVFYLQNKIDASAPQIVTKIHACQHLIPAEDRSFGGAPGGVRMCPGAKPDPRTQTGACR